VPQSREPFEVAITGIGLVTPAGVGVPDSWSGICAGTPTATTDPELAGLLSDFSCRVPDFDADRLLGPRLARRIDRHSQLALVAAREAVAGSGLGAGVWDPARVGVIMGTGLPGLPAWEREHRRLLDRGPLAVSPRLVPQAASNMVAGEIAIDLGVFGPNFTTGAACASGAVALGTGRELLRGGLCDVVVAGGTEASLCRLVVAPFARMGALSRRCDDPAGASRPFDVDRDGFVIAEAAAVLVLERLSDATARGAVVHAVLRGYGASADAYHTVTPDPGGHGVARALTMALRDAGVAPAEVDHVNAHGTSTPLNDQIEVATLRRVLGGSALVTSIKGVTGHPLAAAGAVEAAVTALTLATGTIPPTANLQTPDPGLDLELVCKQARQVPIEVAVSNSFGFGGQNAVLLMTRQ